MNDDPSTFLRYALVDPATSIIEMREEVFEWVIVNVDRFGDEWLAVHLGEGGKYVWRAY